MSEGQGAEVGRAWLAIMPSTRGFGKNLTSATSGDIDKAGKESGNRYGSVFTRSATGPLRALGEATAGLLAVDKISEFAKSAIETARAAQQADAITANTIKRTGGAAHITAGQVKALSTAVSNKTGTDRVQIQTSENMLLAFKNIRNEAGKGNDVFTRTTKLTQDLAVAQKISGTSAAKVLGKALTSPLTGLTALGREGVKFTAGQTKMIQAMAKNGNLLGAQKAILAQVASRYGGDAAKSTNAGKKLSVAYTNLKESIGTGLLPVLDKAEVLLTGRVIPALQKVAPFFDKEITPALRTFSAYVNRNIVPAVQALVAKVGPALLGALKTGFGFIKTDVLPVIKQLQLFIVDKLYPAIATLLATAFKDAQKYISGVTTTIQAHRSQISELLSGVRTLAGFLIKVVVPVFKVGLKVALTELGIYIKIQVVSLGYLIDAFNAVVKFGKAAFNGIKSAAKAVSGFFTGSFLRAIGTLVSTGVTGFKDLATVWFDVVGKIVDGGAKAFGWLPGVGGKIKAAARAFDGLKTDVMSKLSAIASQASTWGHTTGGNFATGFTAGINAHKASALEAAGALTSQAVAKANQAIRAASPAKATMEVGKNFVDGFTVGIKKNAGAAFTAVEATTALALRKMSRQIEQFAALIASSATATAFKNYWSDAITAVTTKLSKVTTAFKATQSAQKSLASSISSNLISGADLSNAGTSTAAGILGFDKSENSGIKAFDRNLALMRKHGYTQRVVNQVAAEGLDTGGPIAAQLAHATATQVSQIDRLTRSISRNSTALGNREAAATYNPQLDTLGRKLDRIAAIESRVGEQIKDAEQGLRKNRQLKAKTKTGRATRP